MNKRAWKIMANWVGGFVGTGIAFGLLSGDPKNAILFALLGVSFGILAGVLDNHLHNPYTPDED